MPTRELATALEAKGFRKDDTHHSMYWLYVEDRKTSVRTRISHGKPEYDDGLLGQVARQMRLGRGQLNDFVECSLGSGEYARLMIEAGHVRLGLSEPPPRTKSGEKRTKGK